MTTINIRIDDALKDESKAILDDLGLDLTSGIKLFLKQVVLTNGIPFEITRNRPLLSQAFDDLQNGNTAKFKSLDDLLEDLND